MQINVYALSSFVNSKGTTEDNKELNNTLTELSSTEKKDFHNLVRNVLKKVKPASNRLYWLIQEWKDYMMNDLYLAKLTDNRKPVVNWIS